MPRKLSAAAVTSVVALAFPVVAVAKVPSTATVTKKVDKVATARYHVTLTPSCYKTGRTKWSCEVRSLPYGMGKTYRVQATYSGGTIYVGAFRCIDNC